MATKKKELKTKKDFINFFTKIPAKRWNAGNWSNFPGTKRCALSHLNKAYYPDTLTFDQVKINFRKLYRTSIDVLMNVNDNGNRTFTSKKLGLDEDDIKGRVLAYLNKK